MITTALLPYQQTHFITKSPYLLTINILEVVGKEQAVMKLGTLTSSQSHHPPPCPAFFTQPADESNREYLSINLRVVAVAIATGLVAHACLRHAQVGTSAQSGHLDSQAIEPIRCSQVGCFDVI